MGRLKGGLDNICNKLNQTWGSNHLAAIGLKKERWKENFQYAKFTDSRPDPLAHRAAAGLRYARYFSTAVNRGTQK